MVGTLALAACQDAAVPVTGVPDLSSAAPAQSNTATEGISDEYIVVFKSDVADVNGETDALLKTHGGNLHFKYSNALRGFSAHMSAAAATAIRNNPNVAFVEQDQGIHATGTASGSQSPAPWGLDRINQRASVLDQSYTWLSDGAGVTVYILDTGIRITHQDFGSRASYGPDLVNATSSDDCNGHGTHIAGTVGGSLYGVAKTVNLVAVRVLGCNGAGTASAAIAGLDWVTANHAPLSVANLSFSGALSASVNQAVANAVASGVTVVVAAGDYGLPWDACQYSPASATAAITVGASRTASSQDEVSGSSNQGTCLDLFAPGYLVVSDWNTNDTYNWTLDGTSSAAAHAAGAAAIYLSRNTSARPSDVANGLVGAATTGTLGNLATGSPNRLLYTGDAGTTQPPPPPPTNATPVASFVASCSKANCSFDASASKDDIGIGSYAWTFGDGGTLTSTSPKATHVYSAKGSYSMVVSLTVTDAGGLTSKAQKTISIRNNGK
jgi:subtilisin family serine protease